MLGSSIGQDASLSSWKDGFDSRTEYQYAVVALWEGDSLSARLRWVRFPSTAPNIGVEASMVMQWTVNPPPSGTPGSIPGYSTK